MTNSAYNKSIKRTIFGSLGRYIAILGIIALGVGFFAGVKNTKGSMMETCDKYVNEQAFYDYRLISTYGFTDDEVSDIADLPEVKAAEGSVTADFFTKDRHDNTITLRAHSLTEDVNKVKVTEGRMPEAGNECIADDHYYTSDDIGKTIKVTSENTGETKDKFTYDEYKIVGICISPNYLMKTERGTTSLGDGKLDAFIYMPGEGLTSEYYTEMLVCAEKSGFIFSEEYNRNIESSEKIIKEAAEEGAVARTDEIKAEAQKEIDDGQAEVDKGKAELEKNQRKANAEFEKSKAELDSSSRQLAASEKQLKEQKNLLTEQKKEAEKALKQLKMQLEAAENAGADEESLAVIRGSIETLENNIVQINAGLVKIGESEKALADGEKSLTEGYRKYQSAKIAADVKMAAAARELSEAQKELDRGREKLEDIDEPEIYVETRDDSVGFASFESNADIVDSIAKVFPVFFFLIAALVCSTTMSRMVEEERSQIGALRALGYSDGKIMKKYMIYSGSAAAIGCLIGFFAGSKYFPYAIWIAYGMMFGFAPLEFYFSWKLAVISMAVALVCSMGTTYFACRGQLKQMPAQILRPKAPKAGKRILIEKIRPLWAHMKFLHKVTARNIFRYKKRMIMMIMGIGGCTALVVAGFGINDSVAGIADHQYKYIEKYDVAVAFSEPLTGERYEEFTAEYRQDISNAAVLQQSSVELEKGSVKKTCNLMITDDDNISRAVNFENDGEKLELPGRGEALISNKMAQMLGAKKGDRITVKYDETKKVEVTVSGVYMNFVSNYIYINAETYETVMGKTYEPKVAFLTFKDKDDTERLSESLNEYDEVIAVSVNENIKKRVNDMMVSLNYIIILVIGCAGALAFIVLFNLGNINITERVREIATIEVLGFYPREMGAYVFRENFILSIMGIIVGFPLGKLLHVFIMSEIDVDAVAFNNVIEPVSYIMAVAVVIGFTIAVDLIMRKKLKKINMAEALKSVE